MRQSMRSGKWSAVALVLAAVSPTFANIIATGDLSPINPTAWTSSTTGYVGQTAIGGITDNSGSVLRSGNGNLGYAAGALGMVTVDGPGSKWSNSNVIYVGSSGTASLTITGGGSVTATT